MVLPWTVLPTTQPWLPAGVALVRTPRSRSPQPFALSYYTVCLVAVDTVGCLASALLRLAAIGKRVKTTAIMTLNKLSIDQLELNGKRVLVR
jgi:hypothetical protein